MQSAKRAPLAKLLLAGVVWMALSSMGSAQQTAAPAQQATVPRFIQFSDALKDGQNKPLTGTIDITFSIYASQEDGTPLWTETQEVAPSAEGNYAVLLGTASPNGVPAELFSTGGPRWLGIQIPGQPEQPRVLLVSVPYALKAADADTLGSKPASAFVMAQAESASANPSAGTLAPAVTPATSLTGSGNTNFILLWTSGTTLGNSLLFQPGEYVQVRGPFDLPAIQTATASTGYNSEPFSQFATAYNSSTKAAVVERFRWQVEPVRNNTASPSSKLNLLFASGLGVPAETVFSIGSKGSIDNTLIVKGSVTDPRTGITSYANLIGGYTGNAVTNHATGATIAGGGTAAYPNTVTGDFGTVSGGLGNTAGGHATTSGGDRNAAYGTVTGGGGNTASTSSTVSGGIDHAAIGAYSTVAGGESNAAFGSYSFRAGLHANEYFSDDGSFVWCQQGGTQCSSKGTNSFVVNVDGGIYFYDAVSGSGCYLSAGSGSWTCSSDRNLKNNIVSIDSRSVLERVAQMPISQWSMKADPDGHKHIGPMAQDFYAAFGLGDTDKYIAQGDAQGVVLASIQGLYQMLQEKLQRKDDEIRSLSEEQNNEIQAFRAELHALEERIARK